jgi:hypothetical protein
MKTSLRPAATPSPQRRSRPRVNDRPYPKTRPWGQHPRRQFLRLAVGAAALPAVSCDPGAQSYPSRPITMIVPYAPGGSADVVARNVAERMKASLGRPVLIENVAGAGGTIGTGRVDRATPDGYTLGLGHLATHVMNGATYALPYDVRNDFEPVALLAATPFLFLAKKGLPVDDLKGLIAWLRAHPDNASQGIGGAGSPDQVAGVLFQKETDTRFGFVPYRGGAPAIQDFGRRAHRSVHSGPGHMPAAGAQRQHQGLCRDGQEPPSISTQYSNGGRGRVARVLRDILEGALGAQADADEHHRQTQCRGRRSLGRPSRACAARRPRRGDCSARAADARGGRRLSEGRDREMVADHQGVRDQSRVKSPHRLFAFG